MNIRTSRRKARAALAATLGGALLAGAALAGTDSSHASTVAEAWVENPNFTAGAANWSASSNARLAKSNAFGTTSGKLTSKYNKKTYRSLSATTSNSSSTVAQAGTYIHSAIRMKSTQSNRKVKFSIQEVDASNKVIQTWASNNTVGTSWKWSGAHLTTKATNSRVRFVVTPTSIRDGYALHFRELNVDKVKEPTPPTNPNVDLSKCENIDYKDKAQGVQTFTEEFTGNKLNPELWRVRDNTFLNQDGAFIDKDNVTVHDGYLDIEGRYEEKANWRANPNANYAENKIRKYSTGYVDSIKRKTYEAPEAASSKRFSQKYGYFEARMWVPSTNTMSQGIWPAFWLRADSKNGEIDILESYGSPTIRKNFDPSPSYEWNSWQDTSQKSTKAHYQGRPKVSEPIWRGWHTYGVNWSPKCLRYTMDGKTVGVAKPVAGQVPYINGDTFNSPFHIRFNMQIGSKYWGWPDPSVTRNKFNFKIDYVRVYQGNQYAK